ncbi:MAG: hypothetical protein M3O82_04860, partial [Verrucomicrobiota bacterium]|nr:hypothetical protein [Verrucomicrobiota bacterium]
MFAVVYIPTFALQSVLRHEPELDAQPVALIETKATKPLICELNHAASTAGVCAGMTASQALARCGTPVFKKPSAKQEKTAHGILLQCAYSVSPWIESTAPGVCTLDLRGTRVEAASIIDQLAQFRLRAQVGIAATADLALLAARAADPFLIVHDAQDFLDQLSINALWHPERRNTKSQDFNSFAAIFDILKKWGIGTVGQFAALDGNEISKRLGPLARDLWLCAKGEIARPLKFIQPAATFEESIELEHEIELLEPLLFLLRRFIEQLSRRLELVYLVAAEITLQLIFSDGKNVSRVFKIPSPTRNVDLLFRMLHTRLENFRADAPIVAMHLRAKPCRANSEQFGLFETALRDPNQFYETLARLSAVVGVDRIGTPAIELTHRPDAVRVQAIDFAIQNSKFTIQNSATGLSLRRFRPPLAAQVLLENAQPVFL